MLKKVIVSLFCFMFIAISSDFYQQFIYVNNENILKKDLKNNQKIFEKVVDIFHIGEHKKIKNNNYDKNDSSLNYLFEQLNYKEIYSDYYGNIFFNRFEEGINFRGLVYLNKAEYVIGIIKTKSTFIDNVENWIIYYSHGL